MAVSSPISATFALMGSTVGTLTGVAMGVGRAAIASGAYGFNGCLVSISLGGLFFVANSFKMVVYVMLAVVFATILQASLTTLMTPVGLPCLTLPFILITWLWIYAGSSISGLFPVDITTVTIAEDHIKRVKLAQKMTS